MANRICEVADCWRAHYGRGWCAFHYARWRRTGSTADPVPQTESERFWAKVEKTEGCWLWIGALSNGYGVFATASGKTIGAHRYAYTALVGPIPAGMQLDHMCHNNDPDCVSVEACQHRRCVNPGHLVTATNAENTRRGRAGAVAAARFLAAPTCIHGHELEGDNLRVTSRGHRVCRTCQRLKARRPIGDRFTDEQIAEIRAWLLAGLTRKVICERLGVSNNVIWRLRKEGRL